MSDTPSVKSMAVNGVAWTMVEKYSGQLIQFVITIILARILTPDEYGLIGMLAIFMGISNVFIDGGLSAALIQLKDRTSRDVSTVFYINVAIATVLYAVLALSAPAIARFYDQPLLTSIVRVYCLSLVISSLASTSQTLLAIDLNFRTTTKITLISSLISGALGIAMAYSGFGVWALVWQSVSCALLSMVLSFCYVRWFPTDGFSTDSFKRLFSFSSKLFAATLISAIYDNFFGVLIGKKFSSAALGYYNRAYQFNQLLNNNVTNVLGRVSYPLLSKIQNEDERLMGIYRRYIQISAFLTFPLLMLLCGVAKPLILLLLTDKWEPSIILLQVLTFGFMWDGVIVSNINLIKVKGRSDMVLKLEVVKKCFAFAICGASLFFKSVLAICIAKAIYGFIALYLNTYYTKKLLNYGFASQFKEYSPYLLASLGVLALSLACSHFITNNAVALICGVVSGLGFYILICHKCKLYAHGEIVGIVKGMLKKIHKKR